jgi:peroxiredoxin
MELWRISLWQVSKRGFNPGFNGSNKQEFAMMVICQCRMAIFMAAALTMLWADSVTCAEIGDKISEFQLRDVSGATGSLKSYSGKIVVFIFWSFKCPVSLAYNERVEKLQTKYADREVAVIGIASGANDNADELQANATNLKITFPILLDSDGSLADNLGATHTPEVAIIDKDSVLRYRGPLDNNKKPGENDRTAYADDAIDAILSGSVVHVQGIRPFGCSIKRRTK